MRGELGAANKKNWLQQIGINNVGRFGFGKPYGETSSANAFHSIWNEKLQIK